MALLKKLGEMIPKLKTRHAAIEQKDADKKKEAESNNPKATNNKKANKKGRR